MTGANKECFLPAQLATKVKQETYDWFIERAEKAKMSKANYIREALEMFKEVIIENE